MSAQTYLGEKSVDLTADENYKSFGPKEWSLYFIERYGQIDGAHHKQWVLDQVARILLGAKVRGKIASWSDHPDEYRISVGSSFAYKAWVREQWGEWDEENEEYEYGYDNGCAP